MKKIISVLIVLFLGVLGLRLYRVLTSKPQPSLAELQKISGIPVDVFIVDPQPSSKEVIFTGTIGSEEEANISAKIGGRVAAVNADTGMLVKARQILVVIDDSQLKIQRNQIQNQIMMAQANVDSLKIQLDDAARDVKRMEELYKENVISQKQLEGYQLKLETVKKSYDSAQKNLQVVMDNLQLINTQIDDCIVRAPFDGIIGNKRVEVGEIVGPGQILMTLYNIEKLDAQMKVPEVYIPSIKKGLDAKIEVDALGNETFYGKIIKISGAPEPKTRMFVVHISFFKKDPRLKPGMFARAKIVIDRKSNALIIPSQAIFEQEGKKFVYIVENQQAKKVEITTGQESNGKIEILSGLSAGDHVIISGKENLSPGTKVNVSNQLHSQ
ncbi:MAG: efflux RND transporter periplasmic adaptor subunit [Candidatus Omnitrophica bacterium]|nr:efflux RND transporter periplasmic adaptor subunit [Candidatus Omnitrophota bacterium]MCM8816313.1 efflux RND transporter periplasmic adaptor subunit [Candidatus Omnitrophota bacterium]